MCVPWARFTSKSPARARGYEHAYTAACKQIGEIVAIATKLYVPIADLSARVRTLVRRMQMRQIACSKIEVMAARWLVIPRLLSRRWCRRRFFPSKAAISPCANTCDVDRSVRYTRDL